VPLSATFLRVRSDEQLVSLFRAGSDDAFRVIHDRYQARLLAYARQMLRGSGGDAEDALQDVFVRAFKSLRANNRPILLRAWLYRIAHNRCIDELRRPIVQTELDSETTATIPSIGTAQDPSLVAERNQALASLVADVQTLPPPQRSALLMRELQGLSYLELSETLGVSVPAVKSLLLRARTGLVDIKIAREMPCEDIRLELVDAVDRGVRMNARCRRHTRECSSCRAYHRQLRGTQRRLAALLPAGPLAKLAGLLGIGGGGGGAGSVTAGGAAAGGGAAASGAAVGGGATSAGAGLLGLTTATAAKVAVVVATAAVIGTAGPSAVNLVSGSSRTGAASGVPADASRITAITGATVGPSSAAVDAGLASPTTGSGGTPAGQTLVAGVTGASGLTGPTGTTGASGASGDTGTSGASGATNSAGATESTGYTSPPASATETAGTTGPTASAASASQGATSETGGSSDASGSSGTSGTSGDTGGTASP
jgi:RNA polymerase sigma factor (sigma-70 family)